MKLAWFKMHAFHLALVSTLLAATFAEDVIRKIKDGTIVGFTDQVNGIMINQFLGIPYAQPPVGKLRFRHPLPVKPWGESSYRNAKQFGAQCYQSLISPPEFVNPAQKLWYSDQGMSEDCLYLNVWAPINAKNATVMIWIFGGGFFSGSSSLPLYDGSVFAAHEDVVIVSMEYRLLAQGFLYLGTDDAPGNQGLMDQNMAIKWVADNIEVFGGNPKKITLFGESAGSASVSMHLISDLSQNYISRAIMESASYYSYWSLMTKYEATIAASKFVEMVGCQEDDLSCLLDADAGKLVEAYWLIDNSKERAKTLLDLGYSEEIASEAKIFFEVKMKPIVDDYFIPAGLEMLSSGNPLFWRENMKKSIPVMIGTNTQEGAYFLLYGMDKPSTGLLPNGKVVYPPGLNKTYKGLNSKTYPIQSILPERLLVKGIPEKIIEYYGIMDKSNASYSKEATFKAYDKLSGDINFKCPSYFMAISHAASKSKTYGPTFMYEFERRTKNSKTFPEWTKSMHGYEIEYVFGAANNPRFQNYNFTNSEKDLSNNMMKMWAKFAADGNPSTNFQTWPEFTLPTDQKALVLDANSMTTRKYSRVKQCQFLEEMLDLAKKNGPNRNAANILFNISQFVTISVAALFLDQLLGEM